MPPVDAGGDTSPTDDASDAGGGDAPSESGPGDASGTEGGSCVLPAGATLCCGSVACADQGGFPCATPGVCTLCEQMCTDPTTPVCCPAAADFVVCAATPNGC
jgi:hypothetical protein